jgi:hypothetical protein
MPNEHCRQIVESGFTLRDYIPFAALISGKAQMATPLTTRLVETVIMSVVAGGFAMYVSVEVVKTELNSVKSGIIKLDEKVEIKFDQLDNKIEKVRGDLYVPRGSNK